MKTVVAKEYVDSQIVVAKEYVDSQNNEEAKKWKDAYNRIRKRSYITQFDDDELTLLASNIPYGSDIHLSQPFTNFDGLYIIYCNNTNEYNWQSSYISSWELLKRITEGTTNVMLLNTHFYWYINTIKVGSTTSLLKGVRYGELDLKIKEFYGVKLKEVT